MMLTDKEQTNSLTTITVKMEEISSRMKELLDTGMTFVNKSENTQVQKDSSYDNLSQQILCGPGAIEKNGQCVPDTSQTLESEPSRKGRGCLITTATYGSERAPQVNN